MLIETLYPFDLVSPICGGPTMTVLEVLEGPDKSDWVSVHWWDHRGVLQEAVLQRRSVRLLDLEQATAFPRSRVSSPERPTARATEL